MIDGTNEYRIEYTVDDGCCCKAFMAVRAYSAAEAVRSVRKAFLEPITIRAVWILRQRWEVLGDLSWNKEGAED